MKTKLIVATHNPGKAQEIREILDGTNIEVLTLNDIPEFKNEDIEETGTTFFENARIKARYIHDKTKLPVLSDDSGLCVDALDGAPGVYSARYAGEDKSHEANNKKLLTALKDVPTEKRTARFHSTMVFYDQNGKEHHVEGNVFGRIATEPKGTNGFGYDPVFFVPDYGKTMAELPIDVKNSISHRNDALQKILPIVKETLHSLE